MPDFEAPPLDPEVAVPDFEQQREDEKPANAGATSAGDVSRPGEAPAPVPQPEPAGGEGRVGQWLGVLIFVAIIVSQVCRALAGSE